VANHQANSVEHSAALRGAVHSGSTCATGELPASGRAAGSCLGGQKRAFAFHSMRVVRLLHRCSNRDEQQIDLAANNEPCEDVAELELRLASY